MVSIADEIGVADLDQLDRRQAQPTQLRPGHAHPALLGVLLERVEADVEIVAASFATSREPHSMEAIDLLSLGGRRAGPARGKYIGTKDERPTTKEGAFVTRPERCTIVRWELLTRWVARPDHARPRRWRPEYGRSRLTCRGCC